MFHRSKSLFLRPAFIEDAPALAAAFGDRAVARNLARVPWPYTRADAEAWISAPRDPLMPSLLVTVDGVVAGGCGLHEGADGIPELGYWIAREWWGRGLATEAARGLLQIARMLGHRKVRASHMIDNPASGRVLRKLGFHPTGRIVKATSLGRGGVEVDAFEYDRDLSDAGARMIPAAA